MPLPLVLSASPCATVFSPYELGAHCTCVFARPLQFCHPCRCDGHPVVLGPVKGCRDEWSIRACRRCGAIFNRDTGTAGTLCARFAPHSRRPCVNTLMQAPRRARPPQSRLSAAQQSAKHRPAWVHQRCHPDGRRHRARHPRPRRPTPVRCAPFGHRPRGEQDQAEPSLTSVCPPPLFPLSLPSTHALDRCVPRGTQCRAHQGRVAAAAARLAPATA